jgi:hypothetical protein
MTDSQFAANRANAANSTGPRTTDGKARSSQNARKHGFAAAAYTVPRLEDLEEVAFLREGAIKLYQPANAQELFAVERIAVTEHAMNRAARLEAGTFATCLNDVLSLREHPLMEMDPEMYGGGEPGKEQVKKLPAGRRIPPQRRQLQRHAPVDPLFRPIRTPLPPRRRRSRPNQVHPQ